MLQAIKKSGVRKFLAPLLLLMGLPAFSGGMGGESFEIYLNNKLVLQQFVYHNEGVKNFSLDKQSYNDQLTIYYNHCGKSGTGRTIQLKDGQNRVLKQWQFPDGEGARAPMTCKVKDILDLQKNAGATQISLVYFSRQLPAGRLLASISLGGDDGQAMSRKH